MAGYPPLLRNLQQLCTVDLHSFAGSAGVSSPSVTRIHPPTLAVDVGQKIYLYLGRIINGLPVYQLDTCLFHPLDTDPSKWEHYTRRPKTYLAQSVTGFSLIFLSLASSVTRIHHLGGRCWQNLFIYLGELSTACQSIS